MYNTYIGADLLLLNQGTTMFAHYYGSKSKGFTLRINSDMQPVGGVVVAVSGKAEAKKLAKEHQAQPWNF